MKTKTKIFSLSMAALLVLALLIVGIYAMTSASLSVSGNIAFDAGKNVICEISKGTCAGGTLTSNESKLQAVTINTTENGATALATWTDLDIKFGDEAADVTIKFTITNKNEDKGLKVEVSDVTGDAQNSTIEVQLDSLETSTKTITLTKANGTDDSVEVTITFKVTNKNKSAHYNNFAVPFTLTAAETE